MKQKNIVVEFDYYLATPAKGDLMLLVKATVEFGQLSHKDEYGMPTECDSFDSVEIESMYWKNGDGSLDYTLDGGLKELKECDAPAIILKEIRESAIELAHEEANTDYSYTEYE